MLVLLLYGASFVIDFYSINALLVVPDSWAMTAAIILVACLAFLILQPRSGAHAEKAYRQLAAEYSHVSGKSDAVISAITDGVIALDQKGTIQLINPAAEQLVGWSGRDAINLDYKSVLKLVDAKDADLTPATDPIAQALASNKEVRTNNLGIVTQAGKKRLLSLTISPIGQAGSGAIIAFRDITKEKAEEREGAEFISTASHEMRTPVASIEGYLGLALNPATAQIDDKARSYITKAHESAEHLGRLFQDLLDVSKADDGRLANNPKVIDVVSFAYDIVEGLRPKAEQKGLRMLYKPQPERDEDSVGERRLNPVYYTNIDPDHLREVLANLVENAIKYTPKGDVVIDIGGDGEHIVFSVADSGIGIPSEDIPHLFQKFYRVDNTDTREIGGTGLGLYLSRRLAEAMNGRLWVESEYKKGSTFFLEVPRISHEEATRMIEAAEITKKQEIILNDATPLPEFAPQQTIAAVAPLQPVVPPVAPVIPQQPFAQPAQPIPPTIPMQPIPQPYNPPAAPQYQPQAEQYTPVPQQQPANPYAVPRVNTPIASLEQDPSRYLRPQSANIAVPPRQN